MGRRDWDRNAAPSQAGDVDVQADLEALLAEPLGSAGFLGNGVVVGTLAALLEQGAVPLVVYPGQRDAAAMRARTTVDLRTNHVGRSVVLAFDAGDLCRPIVMGVVRESRGEGWPLVRPPGQVEVDSDGARLVVSAVEELVLRCGASSLVLRSDGRIELRGENIVARATQVHRIQGGSVQLN